MAYFAALSVGWVMASGSVTTVKRWHPNGVLESCEMKSWLGRSGPTLAWNAEGMLDEARSGHYAANLRVRNLTQDEVREETVGITRLKYDLGALIEAFRLCEASGAAPVPQSMQDLLADERARRVLVGAGTAIRDPWKRPYIVSFDDEVQELRVYTLGRDGESGGSGTDADLGYSLDRRGEVRVINQFE